MVRSLRHLALVTLTCCILALASPAHAAGGALALRVRTSTSVAHVHDTIRYSLTVENTGSATIRNVTVKDYVDDDLDVVSVPILDRVASAGLSTFLGTEEIFWSITKLTPGERVTLSYKATVVRFGDGRLDNVARVTGSDGSSAEATTTTYVLPKSCFFGGLSAHLT